MRHRTPWSRVKDCGEGRGGYQECEEINNRHPGWYMCGWVHQAYLTGLSARHGALGVNSERKDRQAGRQAGRQGLALCMKAKNIVRL